MFKKIIKFITSLVKRVARRLRELFGRTVAPNVRLHYGLNHRAPRLYDRALEYRREWFRYFEEYSYNFYS